MEYKIKITKTKRPRNPRNYTPLSTIIVNPNITTKNGIGIGDITTINFIDWIIDMMGITPRSITIMKTKRECDKYSYPIFDWLEYKFLVEYIGMPIFATELEVSKSCKSYISSILEFEDDRIGYIYVARNKIKNFYKGRALSEIVREEVLDVLKLELEDFKNYINGEVYKVTIFDGDTAIQKCNNVYGMNQINKVILDVFNRM